MRASARANDRDHRLLAGILHLPMVDRIEIIRAVREGFINALYEASANKAVR